MVLNPVSDVYGAILEVAFSIKGKAAKLHLLPYQKIQKDLGENIAYWGFITEADSTPPAHPKDDELEIHMSQIFIPDSPVRTFEYLHNKLDFARIAKNIAKLRPEQGYVGTTEWIQDAFMVARTEDNWGVIIQSVYHPRMADSSIALQLAEESSKEYLLKPTYWMLEGGNILVESDFALVGMDTVAENLYEFVREGHAETTNLEEILLEKLRQTIGVKHIIPVGTRNYYENRPKFAGRFQPFYHLDLFVTLAGKSRNNANLLFIGDPEFTSDLIHRNHSIQLPPPEDGILDRLKEVRKLLYEREQVRSPFDTPPTFEIRSVPMLFYDNTWYSFNNVLVEITQHRRRIICLDYEDNTTTAERELNEIIRTLKKECERIWTEFEVIWTGRPDFNRSWAKKMGGLRCVSKVMKRGDYTTGESSKPESSREESSERFREPFR